MKLSELFSRWCDALRPNRYGLKEYLLNDGKKHPFAVICPGGGYGMVCSAGEGAPFAKKLNRLGYHAFVVYYRVKDKAKYPNPQEDLKRAIEEIFAHAEEWRLDTDNWSVWGSSAGGHLVASYHTENRGTPKPTALVLVYPVITMGEHTHKGSRDNLLGKNADEEMIRKLSAECNITPDYPASFIWYGTADDVVAPLNTEMMAEALKDCSVPCRVEKYEGIGHGAGLAKGTAAEVWFEHAVEFWQSQK
ncbi:MAG: alpha/beta hydrolase [Clostridia bacterium]|nr:alpha/beta hydrolase [Clostridia bacterium]